MRSALPRRIANHFKRRHRITHFEGNLMLFAIAENDQFKPFRQGIDHRYANTMQTAGHLVGIAVKLAASMKLGHNHLGR